MRALNLLLEEPFVTNFKFSGGYHTNGIHDINDIALLAIFALYDSKVITREKFIGTIKTYHNKTLARQVNTHHCKINNKWYHDESTFTAIIESYNELSEKDNLTIEKVLEYLNLALNKNRNFCIDFLYYRYLKPVIFNSEHINMLEIKGAEMLDYDDFEYKEPFSTSYCCEDCDGPWEDIVRNQYRIYTEVIRNKNGNVVKQLMLSLQTEAASKNKFNHMLTQY